MFPRWELYKIHDVIDYARRVQGGYEGEERIEEIGSIDVNKCAMYIKNENDTHEPKKYGIPIKIIRGGEQWNHGEEPENPLNRSVNRFLGKLHRISLQLHFEPHKRTLIFEMYGSAVPVGALTMKSMKSYVSLKGDNFHIGSDYCEGLLTCVFRYQDTNNLKARIPIRFYLLCDTVLYLETEHCYFVYTIQLKCTISQELYEILRISYLDKEEENEHLRKINRPKFQMLIDIKMEEEEPQLDENVRVESEEREFSQSRRKPVPVPVKVKEESMDEEMYDTIPFSSLPVESRKHIVKCPVNWKEAFDDLFMSIMDCLDGRNVGYTVQLKGEKLGTFDFTPKNITFEIQVEYVQLVIEDEENMLILIEEIKLLKGNERYKICTRGENPEQNGFILYTDTWNGNINAYLIIKEDKYKIVF